MKVLVKNGHRLAVVRPADAGAAMATATEIMRKQNSGEITNEQAGREFHAMLSLQQYTFEGLSSADGKYLIDQRSMKKIGEIKPGDSFVSFDDMLARSK